MVPDMNLQIDALRQSADAACRLMKMLANPDRLMLLCQLAQGEQRVGELEARVGIGQPTLSQQLGVLREEGLVATRREGKAIHYRIDSPQALAVMDVLHQQFCAAAGLPDAAPDARSAAAPAPTPCTAPARPRRTTRPTQDTKENAL